MKELVYLNCMLWLAKARKCDAGFDLLLLKGTNTDAAYLSEYFKQNKASNILKLKP